MKADLKVSAADFLQYRRAAYDLIMGAQDAACVHLDHEVEAWTVHTFARYMEQPHIPTDAVALLLMGALGKSGAQRGAALEAVAEQCVLVDGLKLNSRRWPTQRYYQDMGRLACENRAWMERPPQLFWERVAHQFGTITTVLHHLGSGLNTP